MGYFKNLELEIREMDFEGRAKQEIADSVGLSVPQILAVLDEIDESILHEYAEQAADAGADFYRKNL